MADFLKIYNSYTLHGYLNSVPLEYFSPTIPTYSKILVRPFTDPKILLRNKIQSLILSCFALAIITQEYYEVYHADEKTLPDVLDWMATTFFISMQSIFHICRNKTVEISTLINGLIQFDKMYPKARKKFLDLTKVELLSTVMIYTIACTEYAVPLTFVFGLYWQNPKRTSMLGYWLIPIVSQNNAKTSASRGLLIKVAVLLCNWWIMMLAIHPVCFLVTAIHSLSNLSIHSNISVIEACHGFTQKQGYTWRHIQVLVQLLNDVQKGPLILGNITATSFIFAYATTTLVRHNNSDWMFLAILFIIMCYCGVYLLTMSGGMAAIYVRSADVLLKLRYSKTEANAKEGRWKSRFLRSCSPFKNFFESGKFVDRCTPVILYDNLMALSANILLLT